MIRKSYPWSHAETMFHDQLLNTWKGQMRSQFDAFPETDRVLAMQAAFNLMCETIEVAFQDQAQAREASLKDLELTFQHILDWKKRAVTGKPA
jgi:hypothetical protein